MKRLLSIFLLLATVHLHANEDILAEKKFDHPLREISIIASESGYYPATIAIFKGEKIRFFVATTTKEPTCLLLPEKELSLGLRAGKIAEAEALFEQVGSYNFFCPAGGHKGKIIVLDKKSEKLPERNIASTPLKVWMPKDE